MKRVFLIVSLFTFVAIQGIAQSLTGKVHDENNQPLPGVNVSILNSFMGTSTNVNGDYSLKLQPGKYLVKFSFIGYKDQTKEFQISSRDVSMDIRLERNALMTEDVIVEATRINKRTPGSFEDLGGDELEQNRLVQDIPYMIQLTPSVVATSETGTGVGYTSFRIRGSDPTRINVTIDGIPYNDAESQGTYWVNMPDFGNSVSSVQIQRGVGTSTNGAGAFGGTMNFKTKALSNKAYAEMDAFGGSYNTMKASVKAGTGLINDHFSMDARYSRVLSDGYVDRAFVDHEAFQFSAAYRSEKDLLKASFIRGKQRTGITWWGNPEDSLASNPTFNPAGLYLDENGNLQAYEGQTDNYIQNHYHLHYTHMFTDHLNVNASVHYTQGSGYYEQYKDVDYENMYGWGDMTDMSYATYGLPNPVVGGDTLTTTDLIRRKWMANDFYGGIFSANYKNGRWNASLGGGWNRYDGDHYGRLVWMRNAGGTELDHQYYLNTGVKDDANVYAKVNYAVTEDLNVYGDVQYRHINYDLTGTDDDLMPDGSPRDLTQEHQFDFVNPKAGVFYEISDNMNAYASFAMGHREPTRTHFKDATGDPLKIPKAESMLDYELGYRFQISQLALGVNFYYMDYTDQLVPTGEKNSVGYDIMTNVEDSYRTGVELMGAVRLSKWMDWNVNMTLSQNKIRNFTYWASYYDDAWNETYESRTLDETDIAYSPSVVGASRLTVHPIESLDLSIVTKYVGEQYFDNLSSENRKLDAYLVNNLELSYSFSTKQISEIALRFQVNNVLNQMYSNNAYGGVWYEQGVEKTWAYYFPQAGIHFMGGITLRF